ncbi:hypothetical protein D9611_013792 [Ephemerocybe angulata]|uniref:Enoyl reductase (ER) domain-containing protein n=1 Tax=Ephemerocybe angulata TaxID=980116 RepID=A0A8H5C3G2_9AGAR|nr:hypothetical protein D9611_013792 [Tulosesus angulatus]
MQTYSRTRGLLVPYHHHRIPSIRRSHPMSTRIPLPKVSRALTVQKATEKSTNREKYPMDAVITERPIHALKPDEVLLKVNAVGFNHKDVWVRKGLYPAITIGSEYGGDGAGLVVASGKQDDSLLNTRMFLNPSVGWKSNPDAPESRLGVLGGTPAGGTFADYLVVKRDLLIPSPNHLDDVQVAALPLGGVTAWRAAVVNAQVKAGQHVLITGIGGGVALFALQFCLGLGAHVYVTSGTQEKLEKAIALGAKGGANYKDKDWPKQINDLIQKTSKGAALDAVIDSGGGPIFGQVSKFMREGGRLVCYGMTASPTITMTMREVLKNLKVLGSTMGSQKDLEDATEFISTHKIVPIVSHVFEGLDSAEAGFAVLDKGEQFGKVVLRIHHATKARSHL